MAFTVDHLKGPLVYTYCIPWWRVLLCNGVHVKLFCYIYLFHLPHLFRRHCNSETHCFQNFSNHLVRQLLQCRYHRTNSIVIFILQSAASWRDGYSLTSMLEAHNIDVSYQSSSDRLAAAIDAAAHLGVLRLLEPSGNNYYYSPSLLVKIECMIR